MVLCRAPFQCSDIREMAWSVAAPVTEMNLEMFAILASEPLDLGMIRTNLQECSVDILTNKSTAP
jgi:hypothetical protein